MSVNGFSLSLLLFLICFAFSKVTVSSCQLNLKEDWCCQYHAKSPCSKESEYQFRLMLDNKFNWNFKACFRLNIYEYKLLTWQPTSCRNEIWLGRPLSEPQTYMGKEVASAYVVWASWWQFWLLRLKFIKWWINLRYTLLNSLLLYNCFCFLT